MKIAFAKLSQTPYPFTIKLDGLVFEGRLSSYKARLARLELSMRGKLMRLCDSCGQDFELSIDEELLLFLSDGIYKDKDNKLSDTLEFFEGFIDLEELVRLELEAFLSDYFYCQRCKD